MRKGRPPQSEIRQNVIEILHHLGKGYGYQICKIYKEVFPSVSGRSIYYHLRKGVQLEEFAVEKIEQEAGDYSWGSLAEKIYYKLGEKAAPKGNDRLKEFLTKLNQTPK